MTETVCQATGGLGEACRSEAERTGNTHLCVIADNDSLEQIRKSAEIDGIPFALSYCQAKIESFERNPGCLQHREQIAAYTALLQELQEMAS